MNLEQLIAELQALALAHPDGTPLFVQVAGNVAPLTLVVTESDESLRIVLNG